MLISQQPAGDGGNGTKRYDVIIDVEEKRPRVVEYGGGYSTDTGVLGLLELTNVNFMNRLRQAAIRIRASQRQQLIRVEFLDPRFFQYGKRQFAPLAISAQYLRDSTITRFFRSTIDRGTFGIVQRLDADGKSNRRIWQTCGSAYHRSAYLWPRNADEYSARNRTAFSSCATTMKTCGCAILKVS